MLQTSEQSVAPPAAVNGHKSLVTKLAEVMAEVERVAKHGRNDFHRYDYATEADIVAAVREHMAKRHLMLVPTVEKIEWRTLPEKDGKVRDPICTMHVLFTVLDGDARPESSPVRGLDYNTMWTGNDHISFRVIGEGQDSGDKATYKAMTGATKYALLKLFLIPTGDDPENEAPQKPQERRQRAPGVSPKAGVPAEVIGDPDRPAGDPEAFREESERLFDADAPSLAAIAARLRGGDKTCPGCGRPAIRKGAQQYGGGWFCSKRDGGCGSRYADVTEAPATTEGMAADQERQALLLKASKLGEALGMSDEMKATTWSTYCGTATKANVDPSALGDLIRYLELRLRQKGAA